MSKYVGLVKGKVHDKRIISEYYCGGCGWPVTDHDSYCPECGGELHKGIDKSRFTLGSERMSGICNTCYNEYCHSVVDNIVSCDFYVGAGMGRQVDVGGYNFRFECSICGYVAIIHNCKTKLDELPSFCPSCGVKIIY